MISEIINGAKVGIGASIAVGPVAILCIQRALTRPRISSLVSGLGVAFIDTIMAALAYFLYSLIYNKIQEYKPILGVIGGIIVIIIGVFMLKHNIINDIRKSHDKQNSLWQDFFSVIGLSLSNFVGEMSYIFAFFALFNVSAGNDVSSNAELVTGFFVLLGFAIGSSFWWTTLTMSLSFFRKKIRPRHFLLINIIGGAAIIALGIYTIISTFIEVI